MATITWTNWSTSGCIRKVSQTIWNPDKTERHNVKWVARTHHAILFKFLNLFWHLSAWFSDLKRGWFMEQRAEGEKRTGLWKRERNESRFIAGLSSALKHKGLFGVRQTAGWVFVQAVVLWTSHGRLAFILDLNWVMEGPLQSVKLGKRQRYGLRDGVQLGLFLMTEAKGEEDPFSHVIQSSDCLVLVLWIWKRERDIWLTCSVICK